MDQNSEVKKLIEKYSKISEKQVEERLRQGIEKMGGLCWKFVSPGRSGVPDRIVILPTGQVFFVELKAPGKTPRPIQTYVHKLLADRKQTVWVLSDYSTVDKILRQAQWFIDYAKDKNVKF